MRPKAALSKLLILATLLTHAAPPPPSRAALARGAQDASAEGGEKGLRFRLSEVAAPKQDERPSRVAEGRPLAEAETARLLARLPPLAREAGDERGFKLREATSPPPRAGQTVPAAFATPESEPTPPPRPPAAAALEVLRSTPAGEVETAPAVSLTFSQPMVAVASQEEAAAHVPVTLTPRVEGSWHWLGTQTLAFRPEGGEGGRLPAATDYTVEVPAGTKSAAGGALARAHTFNFSTPPPTLKRKHPEGKG